MRTYVCNRTPLPPTHPPSLAPNHTLLHMHIRQIICKNKNKPMHLPNAYLPSSVPLQLWTVCDLHAAPKFEQAMPVVHVTCTFLVWLKVVWILWRSHVLPVPAWPLMYKLCPDTAKENARCCASFIVILSMDVCLCRYVYFRATSEKSAKIKRSWSDIAKNIHQWNWVLHWLSKWPALSEVDVCAE